MKCMIVVLAVASLCLAEPEADPLHYYAPYGYAHGRAYGHGYLDRPYFASGYATPLAAAVHRFHKREAEADAQFAGPLTPAFGDAVATPRGLESLALNGFSEDLNMDGFVDPVAQAVPAPVVAPLTFAAPAPVVAAAPAVAAPAPLTFAAPAVTALNALPAAAPIFHSAPFATPFATPFAAPVGAVAHAPVVKSVVEAPAVVNTEVHAAPLFHQAPLFHHAPLVHSFASAPVVRTVAAPALAPVALSSTDCVTAGGCAVKSALLTGAPTGAFAHVTSSLVKREAEAAPEADAEADADAYYYGHYGYNAYAAPYAYNPFYNYFGAYSGYYNPYNYNAYAAYAPYAAAPVAAPAPLVAAPAPVVKSVTRPVTYTHIGAHPVAPTTVLETETFV